MKPLRNLVLVAAIHEHEVGRPSGLVIPATADMWNRWFGIVIGVGDETDCVEFGDFVELSRWTGVQWHVWPAKHLFNLASRDESIPFESEDGKRRIAVSGNEMIAFLLPEHIVYRICKFERLVGAQSLPVGFYPISTRIYVKHEPWPSEHGGVNLLDDYYREFNPIAQVVDVGPEVDDVMPGDWVLLNSANVGTHLEMSDGDYSMVRMDDVLAVSAEKFGEVGTVINLEKEDAKL